MVFIEYVTPFIALEGTEGLSQTKQKENFWEEVAITFACLEEDYKGHIRRLGSFNFFTQGFWPFWLFPLNDDYCTFLDALEINEYTLPIGKYPALKEVEKELKAKNLLEFERKVLRYDNYLKKGPSLTRKNERILGYLDRDTFAYLKPHFYNITKLYTDSFFVFPPKLDEDQVLVERQKFNDFLSFNVIQELQTSEKYTLQLMDQWLEHFQDKLAEMAQIQVDTSEEQALIEQLDDQINEAEARPHEDSDQEYLTREEFNLPSLSKNIESDISLLEEEVQKIRSGLEQRDLNQVTTSSDSALRGSRDIYAVLSQFNKNIDRLKKDMEQKRKRDRQQREDEIKSYQRQKERVQKELQDKETNQSAGYDVQKDHYESFSRLRREVEGDFNRWIRKQTDEIEDFFTFHAIPIRGSIQLVGLPVLFFGFLRGPEISIIPYLPKIVSLEQQKRGQIDFHDSREEARIKENLNRYILKKPGVQSFFAENGKLHDLTTLPHFKENIISALNSLRVKNWVTDKKARRIIRMIGEEFNLKV
ncbi:MAG: hypothetical protein RBG13Loki_2401 [Promethearchaeota archaeon CR_4]|nr:MAG: hypothetical protein RBG13Loki_2401 [Candidatus Lokiarchaeota archaeon CR_4]